MNILKIRFGIVGTGFIVDEFMNAIKDFKEIEIVGIYSRKEETGRNFADKYGIKNIFTNMDDMAESGMIDAVYIASPNSFHCNQSIKFLENKIAVFCEKPIGSNKKEVEMMIESSIKNKTLLMEAIKTVYMPNYEIIKEQIHTIGEVRSVYSSYCQRSSRYESYKNGIILNAFKKELSNGSTMDIGLYPTYFVYGLFGEPEKIDAQGYLLSTGVDGAGTMMLKYPEFTAVINHSKVATSNNSSEIIGEKGSIIIEKISTVDKVIFNYNDGTIKEYSCDEKAKMYYEIEEFIKMYKDGKYESEKNKHIDSLKVISILETARKSIGVIFPCDEE